MGLLVLEDLRLVRSEEGLRRGRPHGAWQIRIQIYSFKGTLLHDGPCLLVALAAYSASPSWVVAFVGLWRRLVTSKRACARTTWSPSRDSFMARLCQPGGKANEGAGGARERDFFPFGPENGNNCCCVQLMFLQGGRGG